MSKYFPKFCMCTSFVIFTIFLQTTSLFMLNHLPCINFSLQYFVSLHSSKICFASSFSKHNGHLPLSAFLLTPFSCHIPAISHAIPLLSFLEQHSVYNFLPQKSSLLYIVLMSFSPEISLYSDSLRPDGPGTEFRWGRDFPHPSRPALGSTQPPVQWVPGLCPGCKAVRAWR